MHKMGTRGSINITTNTKNVNLSPSGIQVDVEVRDISPEIGKGLIALQDIPRGTLVWKVLHDLSNVEVFNEVKWNKLKDSKDPASLHLQVGQIHFLMSPLDLI